MNYGGGRPSPLSSPMGVSSERDFLNLDASMQDLNEAYMLVSVVEGAVPEEQRIVHVNQNWQELTGYTLDEVMLTPWTLVMSGRNANSIETHSLNEAFAKGLTMAYVLTCYKKNGAGFCNHILVMHVGGVQHRNHQRSTFCIMMREIPSGSSEEYQSLVQRQQMTACMKILVAVQGMQGERQLHRSNSSTMEVDDGPGGGGGRCSDEEALFDSIARDSYTEVRDYILRNGGKKVLDIFARNRDRRCKLCPPGLELTMLVQGGFMGAVGPLLSRDASPGTGVELSELDMVQYAISHKAFHVAMLLLLCGCDANGQHKCCLTLFHPTEMMMAPDPPLTRKFSAEELCSLYSRSFASNDADSSNAYSNAAFVIRHWKAINERLQTVTSGNLLSLVVPDGEAAVEKILESVQDHIAYLHESSTAASEARA